jgi:hypothetical protein
MNAPLQAITAGLFALRLRTRLDGGDPMVLLVDGDREAVADDLIEDLEIDDITALKVHAADADAVIAQLTTHPDAIILFLLDDDAADIWRALDAHRSRLARRRPFVFLLTPRQGDELGRHGPNLWSWIAGATWRHVPRVLSPSDREERLRRLRDHFQLDDATLVDQAMRGEAPRDPEVAEWLILGRGDLIGR